MLQIKNTLGGGGSMKVLNGILEEYYAQADTIDSPSFVEFINSFISTEKLRNTYSNYMQLWHVEQISENKVLIFERYSNGGTYKYQYAYIATISDSTIALGTKVQFHAQKRSNGDADYGGAKVIMSSDKTHGILLLFGDYYMNEIVRCYAFTLSSDGTISVGSLVIPYNVDTVNVQAQLVDIVKLSDTKVMICYFASGAKKHYFQIVEFDGTTCSYGTKYANTELGTSSGGSRRGFLGLGYDGTIYCSYVNGTVLNMIPITVSSDNSISFGSTVSYDLPITKAVGCSIFYNGNAMLVAIHDYITYVSTGSTLSIRGVLFDTTDGLSLIENKIILDSFDVKSTTGNILSIRHCPKDVLYFYFLNRNSEYFEMKCEFSINGIEDAVINNVPDFLDILSSNATANRLNIFIVNDALWGMMYDKTNNFYATFSMPKPYTTVKLASYKIDALLVSKASTNVKGKTYSL